MKQLPLSALTWVHRPRADNRNVTELLQSGALGSMIRWAARQPPEERRRFAFTIRGIGGVHSWAEVEAAGSAVNLIR